MSLKDKLKDLVRSIAPTIGTALGGPMGGAATKFLADKFLGKPDATEKEIFEVLSTSSPDDLLKLKTLESEFITKMKELEIDVFELEVKDRAGARELYKANSWPQIILSSIFVIGYFVVLFYILDPSKFQSTNTAGQPINDEWLKGVATTIIGVLTAAIPQILAFWFGSSLGSKEKTRLLNGGEKG